jgi:geranylgeranyl reductase family protein
MRLIDPAGGRDFYDVVIVGAGPAGGTAAYDLGAAGKRVLVLEKATLPRYKACGGGISARFLAQAFPFSFETVPQARVDAFTYAYDGQQVRIPLRPGAVTMVMRDQLDAFILSQADVDVRTGAAVKSVVETAENVRGETQDGQVYTCGAVIGADGANSVVARAVGLRRQRQLVAALEVEATPPPDVMERFGHEAVFIFGEAPRGYLWIFPKPDHLSVGIAVMHPGPGVLQETLVRVMARYGIAVDLKADTLHGHPIPLYQRREPIATARVLLAGDAAGLVDPFSGEGIRYAIKSGRIAAGAILRNRVARYTDEIDRQIGRQHAAAIRVANLFYQLEDICLWLGAPNPFTTAAIVDMLADRASDVDVLRRAIQTLPVYAVTELAAWAAGKIRGAQAAGRIRARVYALASR